MSKTKHTPGPWAIIDVPEEAVIGIAAERGDYVAEIIRSRSTDGRDEANAEFIVRACNSHEALVEACEVALEACRENLAMACRKDEHALLTAFKKIEAALAGVSEPSHHVPAADRALSIHHLRKGGWVVETDRAVIPLVSFDLKFRTEAEHCRFQSPAKAKGGAQ